MLPKLPKPLARSFFFGPAAFLGSASFFGSSFFDSASFFRSVSFLGSGEGFVSPAPPPNPKPKPPNPPASGLGRDCFSLTAVVRKILSPHTMGQDQATPGILTFQAMFLSPPFSSRPQLVGSSFSLDRPRASAPRNCGQSSERT